MKMSMEEYLDTHGYLTYRTAGRSMLPLLHQSRDLVTVKKKGQERCKVGDVVLYKRLPNAYVLHRVIEVLPDSYVILGDNCISKECGILDTDILGVMTECVRNGKQVRVSQPWYRGYTFVWLHTISVRTLVKRAWCWLRHKGA
ncbi:MAG: S26 family signal peptidase [Atopobiaceae bacterium]|nr:S26 family signal peptidase [Atopobiaceae bacterium]